MTILDTNVLSALMRTRPDVAVVSWLDRQPVDAIWITSVTLCEARFGLALLPKGKRRLEVERAFEKVVEEDLGNRVLDFDSAYCASVALIFLDERVRRRLYPVAWDDQRRAAPGPVTQSSGRPPPLRCLLVLFRKPVQRRCSTP